jgi:hypothetical protein
VRVWMRVYCSLFPHTTPTPSHPMCLLLLMISMKKEIKRKCLVFIVELNIYMSMIIQNKRRRKWERKNWSLQLLLFFRLIRIVKIILIFSPNLRKLKNEHKFLNKEHPEVEILTWRLSRSSWMIKMLSKNK